jgi:hypothetical protein
MVVRYLKHAEIDFKKWDATILSSEFPFVFAQSFYLNATCPNWDALMINDYESVFPITKKEKFGFKYLPQPPFTSQLGAYGKINLEIEQLYYDYILSHFKLIDLELNVSNKIQTNFITPINTYTINYAEGYKLNQNSKRNASKAVELGFKVELVINENLFSLSQKLINPFLIKEINLSRSTVALLDQLILNGMAQKMLYTFMVVDEKQSIKALAHFLCNSKHALYLKGTNFDKSDHTGSMHLLMKHIISFFENKADFFDFGGGSQPGLANFYKGFGAKPMKYGFLQVNNLPLLIKKIKK